jgi:hypothetical protein
MIMLNKEPIFKERRVLMGLFKEVKCGRCDRRYSSIRGRCPYCGARKNRGGKRAADHGNRQLHFIGGTLFLFVVVVAVIILVSKSLKSAKEPTPSPTFTVSVTKRVDEVTATPRPETTPPVETQEPTPTLTPTPTVTAITLNREDFTLSFIGEQWTMTATLTPADSNAEIKWSSEDESVAIVNENGVVTAIDRGWTYIVCEAGGVVEKCIVRVNADSLLGDDDDDGDSDDSGNVMLSHTDVTISASESETFTLSVRGTSATPTFSSEDTGIATVSPNGVVKAISKGTTNIVVSIDGMTLKCIVRVK